MGISGNIHHTLGEQLSSKQRNVLGALALSAVLALTACAGSEPESTASAGAKTQEAQTGGTLTILTGATQMNLDPAKSQTLAITSLALIERRLTTWDISPDKPARVVPDLATDTGTPSADGTTWTFTLKDGLTFANGDPITSADIKYGIERSFAPELSGGLSYHKTLLAGGEGYTGPYGGAHLDSIATPDDKTIVFQLNAPFGDWPWIVSMPAFSAVPQASDDPATYGEHPVATGPYQVESLQQGTALTLSRNPNWSRETDEVRTAGPDKIVFKMSQDGGTAAQSLIGDLGEAKDAFGAQSLGAAQLALVAKNPAAQERVVTSPAGPLRYLAINTQRPALNDLAVRQAIEYAVDKKAFLIASGGEKAAQIATTLITPGIPGREEFDLYPAPVEGDVEKAKQLLAQAGHANDLNLTLLTANDDASLAQAQAIQQGLQRAGIGVTIKPVDSNTYLSESSAAEGNYDLNLASWQPDFPSPNANIQPLFHSSQIGNGGYNISHYASPEVDALIDEATATVDPKTAGQRWAAVDRRILEDAPVVPLGYMKQSFLAGSNVRNIFIGEFPAYPNYLKVTLNK